jgi:hypothetical protein
MALEVRHLDTTTLEAEGRCAERAEQRHRHDADGSRERLGALGGDRMLIGAGRGGLRVVAAIAG